MRLLAVAAKLQLSEKKAISADTNKNSCWLEKHTMSRDSCLVATERRLQLGHWETLTTQGVQVFSASTYRLSHSCQFGHRSCTHTAAGPNLRAMQMCVPECLRMGVRMGIGWHYLCVVCGSYCDCWLSPGGWLFNVMYLHSQLM